MYFRIKSLAKVCSLLALSFRREECGEYRVTIQPRCGLNPWRDAHSIHRRESVAYYGEDSRDLLATALHLAHQFNDSQMFQFRELARTYFDQRTLTPFNGEQFTLFQELRVLNDFERDMLFREVWKVYQ